MALTELAEYHRFNPYHEGSVVGQQDLPIFYMVAEALNNALIDSGAGRYHVSDKTTGNDLTRHPLGKALRRVVVLSEGADLDYFDFVVQRALELRTELLAEHSIFPPQDAPIAEALAEAMTSASRVAALLYRGYDRRPNAVSFISYDPVVGLTGDGRIVL